MGKRILRMRPFSVREVKYARYLKPFEDAGLVDDIDQNDATELELLIQMINDHNHDEKDYNHLLVSTQPGMKPSDIYRALNLRSPIIPTLYIVDEKDGIYSRFIPIRNCNTLQTFLMVSESKALVRADKTLLKQVVDTEPRIDEVLMDPNTKYTLE